MSIQVKLLKRTSYNTLVERLLSEKQVYAPVKKGKKVLYDRILSINDREAEYLLPVLSVKSLVFPPVETLLTFERNHEGVDITPAAVESYPERVVLGVRPCDARGIAILRQTFAQEPVDQLFEARFEKTTLIGLSCAKADDACFCGNKAGDTTGSDILLTKVSTGDYLAEIVTEKGRTLMERHADLFEIPSEMPDKAAHVATVRGLDNVENLPTLLKAAFDSPVFEQQSLACIGCGTCSYVCPVCGCFDIQDETMGNKGRRVRCWDSCGFSCFTQHTSGHNPRQTQGQRWRQRLMHKFSYMPETHHTFGCVGCGRCIRSCPANLDIANLITQLAHV